MSGSADQWEKTPWYMRWRGKYRKLVRTPVFFFLYRDPVSYKTFYVYSNESNHNEL